MGNTYDIRVVVRITLYASLAFITGHGIAFRALQGFGKRISKRLFTHAFFAMKDIGMGNFP
jgi:heme/copper-type cytochrome/quinol oxidase subunit 3